MIKIHCLTTSHNRCQKTLCSINSLKRQKGYEDLFELSFTVVDDGSDDGTSQQISKKFPEINLVQGKGDLYWAGGMRLGFASISVDVQYDYLFVFNDDVIFKKDAIFRLLTALDKTTFVNDVLDIVLTGDFVTGEGDLSYGGLKRNSRLNPVSFIMDKSSQTKLVAVDTINMNGCLIGRTVISKVGFLESYFLHGGADIEFGIRAAKQGLSTVLRCPFPIGICDRNPERYLSGNIFERFKTLTSPKFQPMQQRFKFHYNYGGFLWLIFFVKYYFKIFFPQRKI